MQENRFKGKLTDHYLPSPHTADLAKIDSEFRVEYIDSTGSLLAELESAALNLDSGTDVTESRGAIRRVLHSIKGESGIVGVRDVYDLCHEAESAFENIRDNVKAADMVLCVKDWIQKVLDILDGDASHDNCTDGVHDRAPGLRALIVDDSRIAVKRVKGLIGDIFECDEVFDGAECVRTYRKSLNEGRPYHLITLDINMPRMNGHQTLVAIRELERARGIWGLDGAKIIMTTTESGSSHIFPAFNEGCEAYVLKTKLSDKLLEEIAGLGLVDLSSEKR